jgi:FAD/FMN-containing dehydrogenase
MLRPEKDALGTRPDRSCRHHHSSQPKESGMKPLQRAEAEEFKADFQGDVLLADDAGYDEVRRIWNATIDRRPALSAHCRSSEDVARAVELARTHDLLVSIRGGGHNIAGNAVSDDGLMIDLSRMRGVQVDANARTASVEPASGRERAHG